MRRTSRLDGARIDPRGVPRHQAGPGLSGVSRSHAKRPRCGSCLDAERAAGIRLTESFAMLPTAAVSGWYFSHPRAHYFGVGQIDRDQATSYAERKGMTLARAERWLAPLLGYDVEATTPADAA